MFRVESVHQRRHRLQAGAQTGKSRFLRRLCLVAPTARHCSVLQMRLQQRQSRQQSLGESPALLQKMPAIVCERSGLQRCKIEDIISKSVSSKPEALAGDGVRLLRAPCDTDGAGFAEHIKRARVSPSPVSTSRPPAPPPPPVPPLTPGCPPDSGGNASPQPCINSVV
uniref:Formin BNI1-like n=1 Tax=Petromyzon marinus TaxID=7757 RepID=A0AAJ7U928_PETMA|nr:formin BNI1-like [Petromyzon marinus]